MARRRRSQQGAEVYGFLFIAGIPAILAYLWPLLGKVLVVVSVVALFSRVASFFYKQRGHSGAPEGSWSAAGLAVWVLVAAGLGLYCQSCTAASELDRQQTEAMQRAREDERRADLEARRAAEAAAHEALVLEEMMLSPDARVARWIVEHDRAVASDDFTASRERDRVLCEVRWLHEQLPQDTYAPLEQRVGALASRADRERRQRAEDARGLECRDGSTSNCACHGSHRGCCSGSGGVRRCEPLGPHVLECPSLDERARAETRVGPRALRR